MFATTTGRLSVGMGILLVLIIAASVGWHAQLVYRRLAALEELRASGVAYVPQWHQGRWVNAQFNWIASSNVRFIRIQNVAARPSRFRLMLGDCGVSHLGFDRRLTPADRRAIALFPEAAIQAWP